LIDCIKVECTSHPNVCIALLVHSVTAAGTQSKFVYNASFLKRLEDGNMNANKELHMRIKGANDPKGKPRTASLVRHRSVGKDDDKNIFTWAVPDLQSGDLDHWGFLPPKVSDQVRVQNPDTVREAPLVKIQHPTFCNESRLILASIYEKYTGRLDSLELFFGAGIPGFTNQTSFATLQYEADVLDVRNMGKKDRAELLGVQFFELWVDHLGKAGQKSREFHANLKEKLDKEAARKKNKMEVDADVVENDPAPGDGDEGDDSDEDAGDDDGDVKMESKLEAKDETPAKRQKTDATSSAPNPSTSPSKVPVLFVMLGGGHSLMSMHS
jgi:hypothetical protein